MKKCDIFFVGNIEETLSDVIPFEFHQVEEMIVRIRLENQWDALIKFIVRHNSLKILEIVTDVNGEHFTQLMIVISENLSKIKLKIASLYVCCVISTIKRY